ncbi:MAG: ricin-type beta-trefoil lectin domain protein [Protaetiibacter sp.]
MKRWKAAAIGIVGTMLASLGVAISTVDALPAEASPASEYPEYPYGSTDYSEPTRGQFHFSTQSGQMNDINGPIYYRGEYHLFYQSNPHSLTGEATGAHWGHAVSTDLVHWTQEPIALDPLVQQVDTSQLWSGSAWVDTTNASGLKEGDDDPILMYTNVNGVSIAYSTDGARTFQMWNGGDKVFTTTSDSRDPKVQWDPDHNRWVMVNFDISDSWGASFYTSTDLLHWTKVGHFANSTFSECPDLYQLPVDGDTTVMKWVLQDAGGRYWIGTLDENSVFVPDPGWSTPQVMDQGTNAYNGTWYASQTFNQMPGGRVVQIGWQPQNTGTVWNGGASIAVDVSLTTTPDGIRIARAPVPELSTIRTSTYSWGDITVGPGSNPLEGIQGSSYEIMAEFDLSDATATAFGFRLHSASDGSSQRTVGFSVSSSTLMGKAMSPIDGRIRLTILVDRDQLEVYGNDGLLAVTDIQHWTSGSGSDGIELYAIGGEVSVPTLTFSQLGSIWTATPGGVPSNDAIVLTTNQRKCLDRDGASGVVQLWDCLSSDNQTYVFDASGTITNGGLCIGLESGLTANGSLVSARTCDGSEAQQWTAGNYGHLVNTASARCLDLPSGNTTNGNQLQVWDCFASPAQSWMGPALVGSVRGSLSGKCVDIDQASWAAQIWDCLQSDNQTFRYSSDGTLRTVADECVTAVVGSEPGSAVVTTPCTGGLSQKWWRSTGSSLVSTATGLCIAAPSGSPVNGSVVTLEICSAVPEQAWRIGPSTDPAPSFSVATTADSAEVDAGGGVAYTVTVTNTGDTEFTVERLASFVVDLSSVLDNAQLDDETGAGVTTGDDLLVWSGSLAVGATVEIAYAVSDAAPESVLESIVVPGTSGTCRSAGECVTRVAVAAAVETGGDEDAGTGGDGDGGATGDEGVIAIATASSESAAALPYTGVGSPFAVAAGGALVLIAGGFLVFRSYRRRTTN